MLKTLMTERDGSVIAADAIEPGVTVVTMTWYSQVAIRATRVYLQSLVGILLAASTGLAAGLGVPVGEFGGLLLVSAKLAVAPAVMSMLQNSLELLIKMDVTQPELRA